MAFITVFVLSMVLSIPGTHGDHTDPDARIIRKEVNLEIVPPSSGVQIFRDGIIYLSTTKSSGRMVTGHVSFGKYQTSYTVLNDTVPGKSELFSEEMGFPYPVEAVTFSPDFMTMYFTKYYEKEKTEKIFRAHIMDVNGKSEWKADEKPVSFCEGRGIFTHPALSADGKMMVFASNMEGTKGGMDIYVSRYEESSWSDPENLGIPVNTESDEMFPYLDKYGNLWFSSNRKPGNGGYDIYFSLRNNEKWEIPQNAGNQINTSNDDISFTMDKNEGKSAFYSVRKKNEPAKLYRIDPVNQTGMQTLTELITGKEPVRYLAEKKPGIAKEEVTEDTKSVPTQQAGKTAAIENKTKSVQPAAQPKPVVSPDKPQGIVYRVQVLGSMKAKGSYTINIAGKDYETYEYFNAGAYKTCIGEFKTLKDAITLQKACRSAGMTQAFVAAFRDGVRTTDPAAFKQ